MEKEKKLSAEEAQAKFQSWGQTHFYDKRFEFQRMSEGETKALLGCVFREQQGKTIPDEMLAGMFAFEVFCKRADFIGLKYTQGVALMCGLLSHGVPGTVVMYLYALKWWAEKTKTEKVTIHHLCEWFPVGFPTEEQLHAAWDGQKVGGANLLDILSYQSESPYHPATAVDR